MTPLPNATRLQWLLLRLSRLPGCHSFGILLLVRTLTPGQRRAMWAAWRVRA